MKRILILTAVAGLTTVAGGCRMCDWLFRGDRETAVPMSAPVCCDPCTPCEPCGGGCGTVMGAPGIGAPMIVTPGPETYAPAAIR